MSKLSKSAACGNIKYNLQGQDEADEPEQQQVNIAQDISYIYSALTNISEDLGGLAEIRCTNVSVETKLSALITRQDDVENQVEYLERAEQEW